MSLTRVHVPITLTRCRLAGSARPVPGSALFQSIRHAATTTKRTKRSTVKSSVQTAPEPVAAPTKKKISTKKAAASATPRTTTKKKTVAPPSPEPAIEPAVTAPKESSRASSTKPAQPRKKKSESASATSKSSSSARAAENAASPSRFSAAAPEVQPAKIPQPTPEPGLGSELEGARRATPSEVAASSGVTQPAKAPTAAPQAAIAERKHAGSVNVAQQNAGRRLPGDSGEPANATSTSSKDYKRAERSWMGIMVGVPLLAASSYFLYDRLILGNEPVDLSKYRRESRVGSDSEPGKAAR